MHAFWRLDANRNPLVRRSKHFFNGLLAGGGPCGLLALVAALCLLAGLPVRAAPPRPLRVLLLDSRTEGPLEAVFASPRFDLARLDPARVGSGLDAESLRELDTVVLGDLRGLDAKSGDSIAERLTFAVRRGLGVVVTVAATRESASSRLDTLLGLERAPGTDETTDETTDDDDDGPASSDGKAEASLLVTVRDQTHPVTQCVTHFVHAGDPSRFPLARRTEVLARLAVEDRPAVDPGKAGAEEAADDEDRGEEDGGNEDEDASVASTVDATPLVWWRREGSGRVLVCALSSERGPSRGWVASLLRRAAEWTAGERVTAPLEGDVELAPHAAPRPGFFLGREVAQVMSFHGAAWLTRPEREEEEKPELVLDSLEIQPDETLVDLGCGNGYFTLRMARRVPRGKVLGVDIQPEMLVLLERRVADEKLDNVTPILAGPDDPKLGKNSVDLVLLVDVYHELETPRPVIAKVREALREKGRLVLVEYRGEDPTVQIKPRHRMTLAQVKVELDALGFVLDRVDERLPSQRILIARKKL